MDSGILIVVSAPSGGGKTSLVKALYENIPNLAVSVSYTTREQRPGEEDGVHYHYIDQPGFDEMLAKDAFLEHARVFGCCYGTSRTRTAELLKSGMDVILEIDWQGAQQVVRSGLDCLSIFILPPSKKALEQRLRLRNQDSDEIISRRMMAATSEISHYGEYDYLVINDDFDAALAEMTAIVLSDRLKRERRMVELDGLIGDLLKLADS